MIPTTAFQMAEVAEAKGTDQTEISQAAEKKFDSFMGDDGDAFAGKKAPEDVALSPEERERKFEQLFESGDFFGPEVMGEKLAAEQELLAEAADEKSDCKIDDHDGLYKADGGLLPDTEYTINGSLYRTDGYGRIKSCIPHLEYTTDGKRDMQEQREAGGEDRLENDDGGHLVASMFKGEVGEGNLVPMRSTINRGDYKRMENDLKNALKAGKEIADGKIDLSYDGDSRRPPKISAEFEIDGQKKVYRFDNVEQSTDLLDEVKDKVGTEDGNRLEQTLKDMKEDHCDASITSVKEDYDENGNLKKVAVGLLNETTGTKTYKEYNVGKEA